MSERSDREVSTELSDPSSTTRALLVDDTPEVRALLRMELESAGFHVVGEAEDGSSGVAMAGDLAPDVVVVDGEMPVMDGMEALPLLRSALPGAVIVMFSSRKGASAASNALAAGADEFIVKGTPLRDVVACLRSRLTTSLR